MDEERAAVLVVEREAPVRAFLEQQLADDGYDVLSAERAAIALELLEASRPDLVLLDAVLPDASGFELCKRLRDGEPGRSWNRDVPVIMVSSRCDAVDRLRGFARGCDDYVTKPFLYAELLARMRAVLRRSAGPRRARSPSVTSRSISRRGRCASAVSVYSSPQRSTTSSLPSPTTRSAFSARKISSATSGASARSAERGRSTRTRAACGES